MARPTHELLLSSIGAARAAGAFRVVAGHRYPDPDWMPGREPVDIEKLRRAMWRDSERVLRRAR